MYCVLSRVFQPAKHAALSVGIQIGIIRLAFFAGTVAARQKAPPRFRGRGRWRYLVVVVVRRAKAKRVESTCNHAFRLRKNLDGALRFEINNGPPRNWTRHRQVIFFSTSSNILVYPSRSSCRAIEPKQE